MFRNNFFQFVFSILFFRKFAILIFVFIANCFPDGMINSEKKIQQAFLGSKIIPQEGVFVWNKKSLKYVITGQNKKGNIIFIHGSPGSWDAYLNYLSDKDLTDDFLLIAVDRPGFGDSDPGVFEPSLQNQSNLIMEFIKSLSLSGKKIFVGHSYGGPVVARISMDYQKEVDGILFLAASLDPDLEEIHWFNRVADWKLVRLILPSYWDVSNQELLPLKEELQKLLPSWDKITTRVIFVQGGNDTLVPPENAFFAKRVLINSNFTLVYKEELNHFIPWNSFDLVKSSLYSFF